MVLTYAFSWNECDYEGEIVYSPGRPAVYYLKNGDPGYPEEPSEIELSRLWLLTTDGKIECKNPGELEACQEYLNEERSGEIDELVYESEHPYDDDVDDFEN